MIIKEVLVENFTNIPAAVANGATRILLADNLAGGTTTASHGVLTEGAKYLQDQGLSLTAMIKPRSGNFNYNDLELKIMERDLFTAQELGIDAVSFGALTSAKRLDIEAMEMLIGTAQGMEIVFNHAFDEIKPEYKQEALDWLVENDITRVLSHGGPLDSNIKKNLDQLNQDKSLTQNIVITPFEGIDASDAKAIAEQTNSSILTSSTLVPLPKN
ncbi:copper homeostasis protein CutC [Holzapfeliella sp. JNUCC 80]